MKAMVLAAGFGTRLRPLTTRLAKPAIPLFDQPLIRWSIERLRSAGVTEVVVNAHHLPETVERQLQLLPPEFAWTLNVEQPAILGTAGGLKAVEKHVRGCGTFIMANSDILHGIDLAAAVAFHRSHGGLATMVLYSGPGHEQYPHIHVDVEGRIVRFVRFDVPETAAPTAHGSFTGIHIFEEAIFDWIPAGRPVEINDEVYPAFLRQGIPAYGFIADAFWSDLGTPTSLIRTQGAMLTGEVQPGDLGYIGPCTPKEGWYLREADVPFDWRGPCFVSPKATVAAGASLGPNVCVNAGATHDSPEPLRDAYVFCDIDTAAAPDFLLRI